MKKIPIKALKVENNHLLTNEFDKQQYQTLIKVVEKYNRLSTRVIDVKRYPEYAKHSKDVSTYRSKNLLDWINSKTPLLNDNEFNYSLSTKIHWILKGMQSFPICPLCGKIFGIKQNVSIKRGYHKFCSIQCINKSEETRNKIKQTNEICYGDPNYNNRELSKKTTHEHYGVDNIFKAKEFIDKNKTKLENRIYRGTYGRYLFDDRKFDSSYEIAYYIWLRDNNIKFEYHPKIYFEYIVDGIKHKYYPDFKVGDKIIEIKSQRSFDENGILQPIYFKRKNKNKNSVIADKIKYAAKHKCMLDNNVSILTENELQQIFEYIDNKYGRNYLFSFYIKK